MAGSHNQVFTGSLIPFSDVVVRIWKALFVISGSTQNKNQANPYVSNQHSSWLVTYPSLFYRRDNMVLERERLLLRKLTRIVKGSSRKSATSDDGRNSSKTAKQQLTGKSVDWSGRPTCTACTGIWRSTGRSTEIQEPNSRVFRVDRPVDRNV